MSELSKDGNDRLQMLLRSKKINEADLKGIEETTDAHFEKLIKDEIAEINQEGNAYNEERRIKEFLIAVLCGNNHMVDIWLVKASFFIARYIIKEAQDRASKERIDQIWDSIDPLK